LAGNLLGRSAQIAIYVVALVSILGTFGVDTTSLIAALGAAGLAIGLALRDTLSNLAAGLILALNGAFRQGDFIEANGLLETVLSIDLMSTELKTMDARKIVVPNGPMISSNIVNYSTYPVRRL
jgi:Small-conductance mechanosensitive channel